MSVPLLPRVAGSASSEYCLCPLRKWRRPALHVLPHSHPPDPHCKPSSTLLRPLYLLFNVAGPPKYEGKRNSHFDAGAVLWLQKQGFSVNLSTIGVLLGLAGLAYWSVTWGFLHMVKFYFVPYLIVNAHLVLITFLQHTDTYVPHYRGESFDWLQGALCTVDRPFGAFVDHMLHHITDTHVCHHVFSKMPFYHATEATEAMKPVLGKYYLRDETPIWLATWNSASRCKFVEDEGDVVWYQGPSALSAKKAD